MKILVCILLLMLGPLQYRFWYGQSNLASVQNMLEQVAAQHTHNDTLQARNNLLKRDVYDLKHGDRVIEARARTQLGMIQRGEIFYQIVK